MAEAMVLENKPKKRFNFRGSLCMPYAIFMALFVIFPLVLILYYAFTDGTGKFTVANWGTVFSSPENWKTIGVTFLIAGLTTVFSILIAYPIAYLLSNSKYNKNRVLVYIFLLPMWINFVIRTTGLKELLDTAFGSITVYHPYVAIVIGMVYDYLPFAILPLYNQMLKMDKNQIEAAADLGANPFQVFIKTIIPMTIPGIVSAATMTFMPTMSSYVIANKMSRNTTKIIGNIIEYWFGESAAINGQNIGSVLSLVMLMIIGISLLIQKAIDAKTDSRKVEIW